MMRKFFFFFKQKTAYEIRISDWSSDVCSSDLVAIADRIATIPAHRPQDHITLEMAPLEIRHRSVRPISAKHAQASRFLQQSRVDRARPRLALLLQLPQLGLPQRRQPDGRARRGELLRSRQEE